MEGQTHESPTSNHVAEPSSNDAEGNRPINLAFCANSKYIGTVALPSDPWIAAWTDSGPASDGCLQACSQHVCGQSLIDRALLVSRTSHGIRMRSAVNKHL